MNTFTVVFFCIQACLVQCQIGMYAILFQNGTFIVGTHMQMVLIPGRNSCIHKAQQNVFGQCTSRAAVVAEPGLIGPGIYDGLGGLRGIAPGLAGPYGLASPLAYDGLAGWGGIGFAAAGPLGYRAGLGELAYPGAIGWADEIIAPYGGVGEGNVAVAGELPVAGTTAVAGQVPIMGAVSFGGPVAAAGAVSITGQCACGAPVEYWY